jgi:hypothetical protein
VTGHDSVGKSVFVSDTDAPRSVAFKEVPGFVTTLLWETRSDAKVPVSGRDAAVDAGSWVPEIGATNVMVVTFPPDAVMMASTFDPVAAGQEYMQNLPGLAECFEMDSPGMHTTDTVDYGMLLEGELHLELDDGQTRVLKRHDVVIQNGTRHAWRNRSDRPATMLFVLVGVSRSA